MKKVLVATSGALLLAGCAGMDAGPTAITTLEPRTGSQVRGSVKFTQLGEMVRITGEVTGHTAGTKGWHIHEKGDCSDPEAMGTGGHFNPQGHKHGGPTNPMRHAGDLGNLVFDSYGAAKIDVTVGGISVSKDKPDGITGGRSSSTWRRTTSRLIRPATPAAAPPAA